ncbi:MAG TPA: PKD domain-containing protein, partial [Paludibacteraceae bacterium]|nr:PKD domain-containing protein [Paludibacteraceae bacterium]
MKTKQIIKYLGIFGLLVFFTGSCKDEMPAIEEFPSPDVTFTYSVNDNSYQLDYYVGAEIKFETASATTGCTWDFGDGTNATGTTVIHKYTQAGTYQVKLTVEGKGYVIQKIFISDIRPIMKLKPIEGGMCEVQTTFVSFEVELPNPEGLEEEYIWTFPEGTLDENGNSRETYTGKDPGKVKFSNVGSQTVRLQVKLGGRQLEESSINVQVAFNRAVPTLYYAVKTGNIMALKLSSSTPEGMKIYPFDMGVKSGQHPLNILFNDTSLYILDCGKQFTYINDIDGNLGDGRITVMSKSGSKVE